MKSFIHSNLWSFRAPIISGPFGFAQDYKRGNLISRLPRRLRLLAMTATTILIFSFSFFSPSPAEAKRKLPAPKTAVSTKSTASGVTIKVKFRSDRKGVILNFANLTTASGASYDLIYDTRGTTQNAGGAVKISSDTATAEVIFGTCSTGVCRYDTGISNAKLQVFITLKNGRKIVKPFRLKV